MGKNKTIFDKIMDFRIAAPFRPFYEKYKQTILYLFFGGLSFVLSTVLYIAFSYLLANNILIANMISWVLVVAFCFITNKIWVFEYKSDNKPIWKQILGFYIGRFFTLCVEETILYIFAVRLSINDVIIKIIAQIIVILLNYLISKFIIFNKKD